MVLSSRALEVLSVEDFADGKSLDLRRPRGARYAAVACLAILGQMQQFGPTNSPGSLTLFFFVTAQSTLTISWNYKIALVLSPVCTASFDCYADRLSRHRNHSRQFLIDRPFYYTKNSIIVRINEIIKNSNKLISQVYKRLNLPVSKHEK